MPIARLFALLAIAVATPAAAQTFPEPTGYVVDAANLIPPDQEAALTQRLEALERSSGNQLAVATIPDLEGRPIEDYGVGLLRAWGVGQAETDAGAILIVAPNDRQVRIEVGYGLEGVLTDAMSSVIVNGTILPRFREGDMAGGTVAGADAIAELIAAPPEEQRQRAAAAEAEAAQARERRGSVNWLAIGFWGFVLLMVIGSAVAGSVGGGRRRGRRYRRGDTDWPVVLWTIANVASAAAQSGRSSGGGFGGFGGGGGGFGGFGGGSGGGGGASGSW